MSDLADVMKLARAWADADPDPAARAEMEGLLAAPDPAKTDLADRFAGSLEFGTAGLRGIIGAGPNRMNRAVVLRTTAGLARYLLEAGGPNAAEKGVAIGFDGRRMSKEFAEDTACVLAAAGIKAKLFDDVVPTPLLAFAVSRLGCAAGVMITASHNPPEYNGYKAYWSNGAQIIPPIDVGILAGHGSLFLTRPSLGNYTATRAELDEVSGNLFDAVRRGIVKVEVSRTFPLREAAEAHRALEGRQTTGSVVLTV